MRFLVDFGAGQRDQNDDDAVEWSELPLWKRMLLLLLAVMKKIGALVLYLLRGIYYIAMTIFTMVAILFIVFLVLI